MRNKKKIVRFFLLFFFTIIVVICFGCNKPMTTESKKQRMKELLKNKYGEEFEVRELYDTGRIEAWCYPINNQSIIFEAHSETDMEVLGNDDYLQTVVGKQIDEKFQIPAEKAFGPCIVSTNIALGGTKDISSASADTVTFDTLLNYEKEKGLGNTIYINVYIENDSNASSEPNEYYFIREVGGFMERYELRDSVLILYFGDGHFIKDVKNALAEFGWSTSASGFSDRDNITKVERDKKRIRIYFKGSIPVDNTVDSNNYNELDLKKYIELKAEVLR